MIYSGKSTCRITSSSQTKKGGIVFAHLLKTSKKGQTWSVGDIHLPRNSFTVKQTLFGGVRWKTPRNKWTALKRKSSFPVGNSSGGKACPLFEFLQGFLNLRLFTGNICAAILNFGERGKRNAQFFSSWKVCYVRMHPYAQCYNLFSPPSLATFILLVKTTWETKNKATSTMEVTRHANTHRI